MIISISDLKYKNLGNIIYVPKLEELENIKKKIKRVKNKNDYKKSNILKYILKNYKVIIHDLSNIITNKQF